MKNSGIIIGLSIFVLFIIVLIIISQNKSLTSVPSNNPLETLTGGSTGSYNSFFQNAQSSLKQLLGISGSSNTALSSNANSFDTNLLNGAYGIDFPSYIGNGATVQGNTPNGGTLDLQYLPQGETVNQYLGYS